MLYLAGHVIHTQRTGHISIDQRNACVHSQALVFKVSLQNF
jgi:hypothetical protein